tara:strand:+ start:1288 stop:1878 length:591 start_codon:yes stop_codon:yes gene_type:complete
MSKERLTAYKDKYEKSVAPERVTTKPDLGASTVSAPAPATPSTVTRSPLSQQALQRDVFNSRETGGVDVFKNIPTVNTVPYQIHFNGSLSPRLSDIIFCNTHTTDAVIFSVRLSMLNVNSYSRSSKTIAERNDQIKNSDKTIILVNRKELAAKASTTLSAVVGGLLSSITKSDQNPFYIYVTKTTSSGSLDIAVIK